MDWPLVWGVFVGALVSGVVPLVNAELVVVGAVALAPAAAPLVVVAATVGQMVSKTALFAVARWAPRYLPGRARSALARAGRRVGERGGAAGSLVLVSAAVGVPPFYGVSLASGALGMHLGAFVVPGAAGRLVRFGVLASAAAVGTGSLGLGG